MLARGVKIALFRQLGTYKRSVRAAALIMSFNEFLRDHYKAARARARTLAPLDAIGSFALIARARARTVPSSPSSPGGTDRVVRVRVQMEPARVARC